MAHQLPKDGSSTSKFSGEASDSTIQINVMTLDSQIHSFAVDKNMQVLIFKETIAPDVDVPVGQQRLIFNGTFLKDDHLLSEYHLDNGHTLHLIARRPALVQELSDASAGRTNRSTGTQGSDTESGDLCNWVGANPSLNVPIPNALYMLSEFMHSMEATESRNKYQQRTSSISHENMPIMELPTNRSGLPTPEALSSILRLAHSLLSGDTVATLSHFSGRVAQAGASLDPTAREQIQEESVQPGNAMQQLGYLFLELGRVIQTLHMEQTPPAESSVNSGPAVYVSPSGPSPLMVQISSLFGGPVPSADIHVNADTRMYTDMSALDTGVSNGDATISTNLMALDLAGSIGVVPARNVDVADEALHAVEDCLNEVTRNIDNVQASLMMIPMRNVDVADEALHAVVESTGRSHTISAVEDHLNEMTRDINNIQESLTMIEQELRLHVDYDYLEEY